MGSVDAVAATPTGSFLAGVAASFLLKITTSVDDLVWFSPFLALSTSTAQRVKYCAVYVFVCVLVAAAALCLARAAELGFDLAASTIAADDDGGAAAADGFWDASRVLRMVASAVISVYALVELRGWIREGNELPSLRKVWRAARTSRCCLSRGGATSSHDAHIELLPTEYQAEDAQEGAGAVATGGEGATSPGQGDARDVRIEFKVIPTGCRAEDAEEGGETTATGAAESTTAAGEAPMTNEEVSSDGVVPRGDDDDDDDVRATVRAASRSTYALFAVALCGTFDDMVLFAAVVAGRGIPWTAVLPGSLLAALVVLAVCWRISLYAPFASCVQKVPMWALLGAIAVYLLVGAFV